MHSTEDKLEEEVFPVCSPVYLESAGPFAEPAALLNGTLLHREERYRPRLDWSAWLGRFGIKLPLTAAGFDRTDALSMV